jgi:hypothetical protein
MPEHVHAEVYEHIDLVAHDLLEEGVVVEVRHVVPDVAVTSKPCRPAVRL